jgi:hypothetical protein
MPRSNRSRGPRREEPEDLDIERMMSGWRRTESKRGIVWNVQPITALQATKEYRCPGCSTTIDPGIAHFVVWRTDGVLGDAVDLAARRHWHDYCWKVA